jgi:hypothetical protein
MRFALGPLAGGKALARQRSFFGVYRVLERVEAGCTCCSTEPPYMAHSSSIRDAAWGLRFIMRAPAR